ncbi:MAG TPA: preprotein translocase subunit SecE [Candidatus Paceibacterota bacterium]|nr:preprotein translocase subunit SecE [Candidatus Paceibacterota bacterium]
MFARIKKFFDESRTELRHVNWPTRDEAVRLTSIVIGISLLLSATLGAFDYIFTNLVKYLVFRY